jgi:hypothetical protein
MVNDRILLIGVVVLGAVWFITELAEVLLNWRKRRQVRRQIKAGVVPVDYEMVATQAKAMNDDVEEKAARGQIVDTPTFRQNAADLHRVRSKVAGIRDKGYVAGSSDKEHKVAVEIGLGNNPWPKGSGEAKQWVRGYCMGACITDPKQYMYDA